jgi:hypothetical protein
LPCLFGCGGEEFVAGAGDAAASDAASDAGPGFCASQPAGLALCRDFDEGTLQNSWSQLITKGGASLTVDSAASVSPPNSLFGSAPALKAGDPAAEAFVTEGSLPLGAVDITFDMRIDALSFPANATGATIVPLAYLQRNYEILLAFAPSSTTGSPFTFFLVELSGPLVSAIDAGASSTPHDLTTLFDGSSVGSWQTLSLQLDIDHAKTNATVSVGSHSILVPLNPPSGTANGDRSLTIGVQATAPTGAAKLHFDNVTYSAN